MGINKITLYSLAFLLLSSCIVKNSITTLDNEYSGNFESQFGPILKNYKDFYYEKWEPQHSDLKDSCCFYYTFNFIYSNDTLFAVLSGNDLCFSFDLDIEDFSLRKEIKGVTNSGNDSIIFYVYNLPDNYLPEHYPEMILSDAQQSYNYYEKNVRQEMLIEDFLYIYYFDSKGQIQKISKSYEWYLDMTFPEYRQ